MPRRSSPRASRARTALGREAIVYAGSRAKFTQNPALLAVLLATRGTRLVEASPSDRIWGIGMSAGNPTRRSPRSGAAPTCSARSSRGCATI